MMTENKLELDVALLKEKLVTLNNKIDAAHSRTDKMELMIHNDFTEMKKDLKEMNAWMNRGKGWAAAALLLAGLGGGLLVKLIK